MAVFYNREKAKIGTNTGTIINWSKELLSNDPDDTTTRDSLPAGYLRCDGSIYTADIFPELATVLGVGQQSRYRQANQTLLDNQFQVPDFGSKKLRASSGANLGIEIDLRLENDNDQPIVKSGVGLTVESNIGTQYEIAYQGNFFLPTQQIEITGQPGFVRSAGNYVEESDVLPTAFMPHSHFHSGKRTRQISSIENEFAISGRNSARKKSTLCVSKSVGNSGMPEGGWYQNTYQILCQMAANVKETPDIENPVGPYGGIDGFFGSCTKTYFNACFTGCAFDQNRYECLVPDGTNCGYPLWGGFSSGCEDDGGNAEERTCGRVIYTGTMGAKCECTGFAGVDPGNTNPQRGPHYLDPNYSDPTLPFDSVKLGDRDGYSCLTNVTTQTENFGDDGTHRHFLNFEAQPHTYVLNTSPSFIPAASLISTFSIRVNTENKADQFVQPYIVQEFLIKY